MIHTLLNVTLTIMRIFILPVLKHSQPDYLRKKIVRVTGYNPMLGQRCQRGERS